jgi:hypothetical protein
VDKLAIREEQEQLKDPWMGMPTNEGMSEKEPNGED